MGDPNAQRRDPGGGTLSPSEPERLNLLRVLEEKLGEEAARTMMSSLPPNDWDDLVRKQDIAGWDDLVRKQDLPDFDDFLRKQDLELRLAEFRAETRQDLLTQTRTLLLGQFGSAVTIGALLIAAIRL